MKQLCYVSFLNEGLNVKDVIESIQKISNIKNQKYGLTGRLIYSNEVFIQLLEGEKINVDVAYNIIKNDHRHSGIQILFEQINQERAYPEWSMKYDFSDKIDLVTINRILNAANIAKNKSIFTKSDILDLFVKFSQCH